MSKRIGIALSDDAWVAVEKLMQEANESFESGKIGASDVINEMILTAKVDVRSLQIKHMDLRKSLKALASKESVDVEAVLKLLSDLKGKGLKKKNGGSSEEKN